MVHSLPCAHRAAGVCHSTACVFVVAKGTGPRVGSPEPVVGKNLLVDRHHDKKIPQLLVAERCCIFVARGIVPVLLVVEFQSHERQGR